MFLQESVSRPGASGAAAGASGTDIAPHVGAPRQSNVSGGPEWFRVNACRRRLTRRINFRSKREYVRVATPVTVTVQAHVRRPPACGIPYSRLARRQKQLPWDMLLGVCPKISLPDVKPGFKLVVRFSAYPKFVVAKSQVCVPFLQCRASASRNRRGYRRSQRNNCCKLTPLLGVIFHDTSVDCLFHAHGMFSVRQGRRSANL